MYLTSAFDSHFLIPFLLFMDLDETRKIFVEFRKKNRHTYISRITRKKMKDQIDTSIN